MSFGLRISFGRICKAIKLPFLIVKASGKVYDFMEQIEYDEKIWYITPDGEVHDDVIVETQHNLYFFSPNGLEGAANKKAITKLRIFK